MLLHLRCAEKRVLTTIPTAMNAFVEKCNKIFGETTLHYHKFDNIDAVPENPYEAGTIDDVLFRKNWIDAV